MIQVTRRNRGRRNLVSNILGFDASIKELEQRIVPAYVASDFGWASTFESTTVNIENVVRSSAVDSSGNVYQVGSFTGTVDFDNGPGTASLTASAAQDAFVVKLDSTGQFVWVKKFSGASAEKATSITLDASGNPLITGWYQGTVDFDPDAGVTNLISQGAEDAFIVKLNPSGALQWAKSVGGSSSDGGMTITTDTSGNIVLGGWFYGTADFDPSSNVSSMTTNSGSNDIFVLKLDSAGNFTWVKGIIGLSNAGKSIWDVKTDGNNNVAISGSFNGILDLDPGTGSYQVNTVGTWDGFVEKLDANGNFQWAQQIGSSGSDGAHSIAFDSQNNTYIAGGFNGTIDFDSSSAIQNRSAVGVQDAFLLKLSSTGIYQWVKTWGSSGDDFAIAVAVDQNNLIKVAGAFSSTVDFDPGTDVYSITSTGYLDEYVASFKSDGSFFGVQTIGQPNNGDNSWTMALTNAGRPVLTGAFAGTMDFDPDSPNKSLPIVGGGNHFVTQWNRLYSKNTLAISNSFDGSNTTLTATVVNENGANPAGQVRFYDYYYGVLNTLGTSTVVNGVATLTLGSMASGPHSIYAVYGGNASTFSSKSNTVDLSLDTVTGTFGFAEAFVNRVGTEEASPLTTTFTDKLGNIYYGGTFQGTIDFDSGTKTQTYTASGRDFFLAKLTPDGKLTWFKQWTGNTIEGITDAFVNSQDQIAISGWFRGSMDFDPGASANYMVSNGGVDGFVMTLDLNGNYQNSFSLGGPEDDVINGIAYDSQNNLIVAGYFRNTVNFDPNSFGYNIASKGDKDAFLAKYDSSYYLIWVDQIGNGSWQEFKDVAFDSADNVYVVGNTGDGNLDLNPSSLISPGTAGTFLAKYNTNGGYLSQVNADADYAYRLKIANNNVYLCGDSSYDYGYKRDGFISKYNLSLVKNWTSVFGVPSRSQYTFQYNFAIGSSETIYITGQFNGNVDFDPGTGIYNLTSKGDYDVFVATLNSSGAFVSAISIGSGWYDIPSAIALSPNGSVIVAGMFTGEADFDPSTTVNTLKSDVTNSNLRSRFLLNLSNQTSINTTTTLTASTTSSVTGQPITLNARLLPLDNSTPSGVTAYFYDGNILIGQANTVSGLATLAASGLSVGTHQLSVRMVDNNNLYLPSTSSAITVNVAKASTSLTLSGPASATTNGASASFTARVAAVSPGSGVPSGSVLFFDGTTQIGSAVINGSGDATFATTTLAVGAHAITASYAGDSGYTGAVSGTVNHSVNVSSAAATMTATPSTGLQTSESGSTATFVLKLGAAPTGNVTVNLTSSNTAEGTVSPAQVILNNTNWFDGITVTITGQNDSVVDGNVAYTVTAAVSASADARYTGQSVVVSVTNLEPVLGTTGGANRGLSSDLSTAQINFNVPIATTGLQVYDTYSGSTLTEEADFKVTDSTGAVVRGSVIVANDKKSLRFVKTGAGFAAGTYTVKMRSAANAFRTSLGQLLDGDGNGTPGGDYVNTFTVAASTRTASVSDVVRGPGQDVRVNTTDLGVPIKLSDATDVYTFEATFTYDPALFTVTNVVVPASLSAGLDVTFNNETPGVVKMVGVSPAGLPAGAQTLVFVQGTVPTGATYRSKAVMDLVDTAFYKLDGTKLAVGVDEGIQAVSYPGDTTGDGRYNSLDSLRIQRYLVNLDTWFPNFPMVDPILIADVNGDAKVNALDSLYVQRYLVNLPVAFITAPPVTSVTQTPGLDPVIRLPKNLTARRGQVVQVPIEIVNTDSQAIKVNTFEVAIAMDPKTFRMLKVNSEGQITQRYDVRRGVAVIGGILPEVTLEPGESHVLATLNLKVAGNAKATDVALNLLDEARFGRERYVTSVNAGDLVLIPGPTSGSNDSVDGKVRIMDDPGRKVSGGGVEAFSVLKQRKPRFIGR